MKKVSAVNYQRIIFVHPKIVGLFNQLVYFYVKKHKKKNLNHSEQLFTHNITQFLPIIFTFWDFKTHTSCREKNKESDIQYTLKKNFVKKL